MLNETDFGYIRNWSEVNSGSLIWLPHSTGKSLCLVVQQTSHPDDSPEKAALWLDPYPGSSLPPHAPPIVAKPLGSVSAICLQHQTEVFVDHAAADWSDASPGGISIQLGSEGCIISGVTGHRLDLQPGYWKVNTGEPVTNHWNTPGLYTSRWAIGFTDRSGMKHIIKKFGEIEI